MASSACPRAPASRTTAFGCPRKPRPGSAVGSRTESLGYATTIFGRLLFALTRLLGSVIRAAAEAHSLVPPRVQRVDKVVEDLDGRERVSFQGLPAQVGHELLVRYPAVARSKRAKMKGSPSDSVRPSDD